MQDERDFLMRRTFPRLRMLAAERDVTLSELDLRWGITQEESESGKVVGICLNEIENSIPFFIGIIGNRYGWIPQRQDLDVNTIDRYEPVKDYLARQISVTEMEMQFGVLERPEDMHAYFYIKEDSDQNSEDSEKLAELKQAVRKNGRYPVSSYTDAPDLAQQVETAFLTLLDKLFPLGNLSELEKERIGQRAFLNQLCQNYVRNQKYFDALDSWLKDWDSRYLVISGASGQGKSALVANWIKEKEQDETRDFELIYHFVGDGGSVGEMNHVIKVLESEIKERFSIAAERDSQNDNHLSELFAEVSYSEKKLLVVLDAVNQFSENDVAKQMRWLPSVPQNIKILFSTLPDDSTMVQFHSRKYPVLQLKKMSVRQREDFISSRLSAYGKKLTCEQQKRISTAPVTSNALVLSTLLDELIKFGKFDNLNQTIDYYVMSRNPYDFYNRLLYIYEQALDTIPAMILMHLAVSRFGLKETEVLQLTKLTPLQWAEFYSIFRPHFVVRNGLISFRHEYLRTVVQQRYLNSMEDAARNIRLNISTNLNSDFARNCVEIPYQDYVLENYEALHNTLIRPNVFQYCYSEDDDQLTRYWRSLLNHGYDIKEYLGSVNKTESYYLAHQLSCFCTRHLHDSSSATIFAKKARELYAKESAQDRLEEYEICMDLADSYADASDYDKAIAERKAALCILQNLDSDDDKLLAEIYNALGEDYFGKAEYEKAFEFAEIAMRHRITHDGEYGPLTAICYNNIGVILDKLERYQEAIEYSLKALAIRKSFFGDEYGPTIVSYSNVGLCYSNLNQADQAMFYYKKALKLAITVYGQTYSGVIDLYTNIGTEYHRKEDFKKACHWYKKALTSHINIYGADHLGTEQYLELVISECKGAGDKRGGIKYMKQRVDYILRNQGKDSEALPYLYNNIGVCYRQLGYNKASVKYSVMSVELAERLLGPCLDTAITYDRMGQAYQSVEDNAKAKDSYKKAINLMQSYDNDGRFLQETRLRLAEIGQ